MEETEARRINRNKATIDYYDRLSRWYDLLAGKAENKCKLHGLKLLNVQPDEKILEVGCGTGQGILILAQAVGSNGKVHGIDLSSGMLKVANIRLLKSGLHERVQLRQADALQLPFEDDFFDAIFMSFTLELFTSDEIGKVLAECWRVLVPDGRISIVAMAKKEKEGLMLKLYNWAHQKWPVYIDCRPIDAQVKIERAGFEIARNINMSLFGLPVDIILARKSKNE